MQELCAMIYTMQAAGAGIQDIAVAVSTRRNEIRLESYKDDPEGLAKVKKSNLENFGNENGGTPEFFYNKYGTWETVLEKALSVNPGADAVLGLYDEYYGTYYVTTYIVVPGDCLSSIAERTLGDKGAWRQLYELSKDIIRDPNRIYAGQALRLQ